MFIEIDGLKQPQQFSHAGLVHSPGDDFDRELHSRRHHLLLEKQPLVSRAGVAVNDHMWNQCGVALASVMSCYKVG